MSPINIPEKAPKHRLNGFSSYKQFKEFISPLLNLSEKDLKGLFNVLVKLESVGENPIDTVYNCKYQLGNKECLEMIKFMIQIDEMDLEEFNKLN